MLHQRFIRLGVVVSMILLLLMGVMPKPVVHEWITGHEHTVVSESDEPEISTAGNILTCDCHEVVFTSPYEAPAEFQIALVNNFTPCPSTDIPISFIHVAPDNRPLRGPPTHL